MRKVRMAAAISCKAYMRRDRLRYMSLHRSLTYARPSQRSFSIPEGANYTPQMLGKDSEEQLWKHRSLHAVHAPSRSCAYPTYVIHPPSCAPRAKDYLLLFVYRQGCGKDRSPIGL